MENQILQGFQLSPQQRRLWWIQQEYSAGVYALECAVQIEGELDQGTFMLAWAETTRRHEILGTTFRCLPGMALPLQVVLQTPLPEMEVVAIDGPADREQVVKEWFHAAAKLPFDLEQGPLLQAVLFHLGGTHYQLLFRLPVLCGDSPSAANLVRELGAAYGRLHAGDEPAEEPLQYADLSNWQNDLLAAEETQPGREYWRRQNFGGNPALDLPFEKAQFPLETTKQVRAAGRFVSTLGFETWAGVGTLAEKSGVEPAAILLTCWAVLVARLQGTSEIVVGTTFEGRQYQELEGALGLLARCLPIRCRSEPRSPFAKLVHHVEGKLLEARQWQDAFAWEHLGAAVDESYFPLGFEFRRPPTNLRCGGLLFQALAVEGCVDRNDLRLSCMPQNDSLWVCFDYDPECFRAGDIALLAERFEVLTAGLVADPRRPLWEAEFLTTAERRQLLVEFNETATPHGAHQLVHRRIEECAAAFADRVGLIFEERSLSYGQFNHQANRLARHLANLGVRPEDPVVICLERSAEYLVAMLAVLKVGGAYLPIDTTQPKDRLGLMLDDFSQAVLLTRQSLLQGLPSHRGISVLLDSQRSLIAQCRGDDLVREPAAENLAYLLFTSGSTGEPRAVAVGHRALSNYVSGAITRLDLPSGASYATVSTFAADLGNTMVFPALCTGGVLHVISQQRAADALALAEYGERYEIDCLKIVPGHLEALLSADRPMRLLPRQRLVLGGEAVHWRLLGKLRQLDARCQVFNHYGPTETTVGVLTCRLDDLSEDHSEIPPLRQVMENCRIYLLDPQGQPVAPWVPGEIHIGGAGLSRGYFARPALTAQRFVPDSLSGDAGSRFYRTGDLARILPDGKIHFLRRLDRQVKIRGYRVELGEVEAQLARHPSLEASVVVARLADDGAARLLAYLVPAAKGSTLVEEVRHFLDTKLPEYMMPSAFVLLDALPLSANGKVDAKALPEPVDLLLEGDGFTAPRTPVEEILAGLWGDLLGLGRVSVDGHFFLLGGHSLLATQLVSRLREVFQVEIPLRKVFEVPTLGGMAQIVEDATRSGAMVEVPPIGPAKGRWGDLPLSFAQERHWFLQELDPGSPLYNIRGAVRIRGNLRIAALAASFLEVIRRHEVLATAFRSVSGRPVQRYSPISDFDLPISDLCSLSASEREGQVALGATRLALQPFDLERPPLLRAHLFRLAEDDHIIALTMHHIVADMWSMRVLISELMPLYGALLEGLPSPLPPLLLQYRDFASWQRGWLQGEVLESEIVHWRKRLEGAPRALELSIARPRPLQLSGRSGRLPLKISAQLTSQLKALSQQRGGSLFQLLLACFQVLLRSYGGGDDIVIGAPIANRNRMETEGLIGCFINALALRAHLGGDLKFSELLSQVREAVLSAYTHQDVPFEKLVQDLNPDRDAGLAPIFQVVFNFANLEIVPPTAPGLELELWGSESVMDAKYDLILTAVDQGDDLTISFTYSLDLFDRVLVGRMLTVLGLILNRVVEQPEIRLDDLSKMAAEEDRRTRRTDEQQIKELRKKKLGRARRKPVASTHFKEISR